MSKSRKRKPKQNPLKNAPLCDLPAKTQKRLEWFIIAVLLLPLLFLLVPVYIILDVSYKVISEIGEQAMKGDK